MLGPLALGPPECQVYDRGGHSPESGVPPAPATALEDRRGKVKAFPLGPGFHVDGAPVTLTPPKAAQRAALAAAQQQASRTASGSVAVHDGKARVARAGRP